MTSCPSELRFWCAPNNQGLPGVTLAELAELLTPFIGGGGNLKQAVFTSTGSVINGTGIIPFDDTIPQQTEGFEVLTLSITPTDASNVLLITSTVMLTVASASVMTQAIFRDATADSLAAHMFSVGTTSNGANTIDTSVVAGSVAPTTIKMRIGTAPSLVNVSVNGNTVGGVRLLGGAASTTIRILEIEP